MMKRPYFFIFILCIAGLSWSKMYGGTLPVNRFDTQLPIGLLNVSEKTLKLKEETFSLYETCEHLFVPLQTVIDMGIAKEEGDAYWKLTREVGIKTDKPLDWVAPNLEGEMVFKMGDKQILLGDTPTYSIQVEGATLIPLKALSVFFEMIQVPGGYLAQAKSYEALNYLEVTPKEMINTSMYPIYFDYLDMYWDGENFIDVCTKNQIIEPQGIHSLDLQQEIEGKAVIYLGTYLESVQDFRRPSPEVYGQRPTSLYQSYEKAKRIQSLEKIFPKFKVMVKMNYQVGTFENGQEVQLWRSEKGQYHVLIDETGKKVIVPLGSVQIIGDNGQGYRQATQQELEDYVNLKDYESQTTALLWTDLLRQRTYAFEGKKNQWKWVKTMKCSTGKDTSLTPSGTFEIQYKIPYFGERRGFRCKNASVIFRDYMYHSILFDKTGQYVKSGLYQLGSRVSHGCVRLSEEDSEWIYKNVPEKSKVYIE
ncbi:MAG: L,D-transpeptidase [Niameybacter sp.]